jgi:hypothetical protein
MTQAFKDAIAERLAEDDRGIFPDPCSEPEKEFLRRWADALKKSAWGRIAKRVEDEESDIIKAAIWSLRSAKQDDKINEDIRAAQNRAKRDKLLRLACMADELATFYEHVDIFSGALTLKREFGPFKPLEFGTYLKTLVELHRREADTLRKCAPTFELTPSVKVSQKTEGREQRLFMQRMSLTMMERFGAWHDLAVAEITSLAYPKAKVSEQAVVKQREKSLRNATTPFSPQKS